MTKQNIREHALDMMEQGKMTADEANVFLVRCERVRVIVGRVPASVRKALNDAVKSGELGHMKKSGLKPEVYYHPNFKSYANAARNKAEQAGIEALKKVMS